MADEERLRRIEQAIAEQEKRLQDLEESQALEIATLRAQVQALTREVSPPWKRERISR